MISHPEGKQPESTEQRLRALLEEDFAANKLAAARGNMINRAHYAKRLGLVPSRVQRYLHVFEEYESKAGIKTGPERLLPSIREWLEAQYESGQLMLRDGKIDRKAIATRFAINDSTFSTRYPKIKALIDEFDTRANTDCYLPKSLKLSVEKLTHALSGEPTLNSDRKTINVKAIAKQIGLPAHRLRKWPFDKHIAQRQAEILEKAKASRIDPIFHERVFAFSDLAGNYPIRFLERVAIRFKQLVSGRAEAGSKLPYLNLFGLLEWIGKSHNEHCEHVRKEAREDGRVNSQTHWEEAVFSYRAHLIEKISKGQAQKKAVGTSIRAIRVMIEGLATANIVPHLSVPLPSIKQGNRTGSKLKSVAEVAQSITGPVQVTDYLEFAKARLAEARNLTGVEVSQSDASGFFQVLAADLEAEKILPADISRAILVVLRRRLDALRTRCESIVAVATEALHRGEYLLSISSIDVDSFERQYFGDELTSHQKKLLLRSVFPVQLSLDEESSDLATANLLRLIEKSHGRIPPTAPQAEHGNRGQFFTKRFLELGGAKKLSQLLIPDSNVVGAVLTLYLIESGANISVGRTLSIDCMEPSTTEDHCSITGHKARADGKPIITELPNSSAAVRSMAWLKDSSFALRSSTDKDSDRLFIANIKGEVKVVPSHWYTAFFARLIDSIPELCGLKLSPNMIRPSVLLEASLSNDGRLKTGIALAQHTEGVAQGYQQKWPTRLLYDQNIRRFSLAFETLVLSSIDDAAKKLGLSATEFEGRLSDIKPTGLGTLCAGNGRRDASGDKCSIDCWNDCPNLLLIAEVNAIATLQLWQTALLTAQPDWERDRPERWDEVWLPWLCFTTVVEEKMTRGPLLKVWRAATGRAAEIASSKGYVAPRPW